MKIKCPNCQYEGKGKTYTKGSTLVELFLWLMFIVPGFIYSLWRLGSKYTGCPQCGFTHVVKVK
jgi:hypothetical protein